MRKWKYGVVLAVPVLFPPLGGTDGPAKTGDFLAWCKDHAGACEDRIATVETSLVADADKRYCAPADYDVAGGIPKVQAWLGEHAEENGRDTDAAITDAWIALHPCKA
jgi:hypothetical protein